MMADSSTDRREGIPLGNKTKSPLIIFFFDTVDIHGGIGLHGAGFDAGRGPGFDRLLFILKGNGSKGAGFFTNTAGNTTLQIDLHKRVPPINKVAKAGEVPKMSKMPKIKKPLNPNRLMSGVKFSVSSSLPRIVSLP
jgi:hypothetical protein